MLATVITAATHGVDGFQVRVEVHVGNGLPAYHVVGLPDAAVRESRERVGAALESLGWRVPPRRLTINLAPAGVRKVGPSFDLPIALGILRASGQLRAPATVPCGVIGELALDGRVRGVRGALCLALAMRAAGVVRCIVPSVNAAEAALAAGVRIHGVEHLRDVVRLVPRLGGAGEPAGARPAPAPGDVAAVPTFDEVRGQERAKRALAVAAAGGHHLLLVGPPGSGKTMLARRLPSVLPGLEPDEALEATRIASVAGLLAGGGLVGRRPFRAPHHTVSLAGMIGGGRVARPGEISLAHQGVLFLDELAEFRRPVLEALRQPLEEGVVRLVRVAGTVTFPARFMLAAAMNPCPCGWRGDAERTCRCTPYAVQRYLGSVSGPLLDRIDLHLEVERLRAEDVLGCNTRADDPGAFAVRVAAQVAEARQRAARRYRGTELRVNADLGPRAVHEHCRLSASSRRLLAGAIATLGLSARAGHRVLKLARSIADLEGREAIHDAHVAEAIAYRGLDRRVDPA